MQHRGEVELFSKQFIVFCYVQLDIQVSNVFIAQFDVDVVNELVLNFCVLSDIFT